MLNTDSTDPVEDSLLDTEGKILIPVSKGREEKSILLMLLLCNSALGNGKTLVSSSHTHYKLRCKSITGKGGEEHTGKSSSVLELEKPEQQPCTQFIKFLCI